MRKSSSGAKGLSFAIVMLALAILTYAVSFTQNPSISPLSSSRPDTNDSLVCSWNATDSVQANVTWYNGSVQFLNDTGLSGSSSTLSHIYTTRGENWYCNVTISNITNIINSAANVTIKNAAPTTPTITNSTGGTVTNLTEAYEDVLNTYTVFSSDPDIDTITYGTIGGTPSGSSFDSNTGIFTWTPTVSSSNTNITFYATDSFGDTPAVTTRRIQFNVTLLNDAPVFSPAITNQTINESQVFNYVIAATDEESNYPLNFSITVTPSLPLVVSNTSSAAAVIMFAANASAGFSDAGNYTVNISVKDSLNGTTSASFRLQILPVNRAPVLRNITSTSPSGTQGQMFSWLFYADDADENQTLTFSVSTLSCGDGNIWDNITTTMTSTANSSNATGNLTISLLNNSHVVCRQAQIIVVDDRGAEDSETVFLNITNTNDPPIVQVLSFYSSNTGGQRNLTNLTAYANGVFTYRVNATDIDSLTYEGETLTYTDNTSLFVINSSTGEINFTPTDADVGVHSINITVSDDSGATHSAIMNITVIANTAPVLNAIGDITCFEDILCYIYINASDADNDNITFSSSNTAAFNITLNTTATPVWRAYVSKTYLQSSVGTYNITITATDIRGATDNETIVFTLNNTNDAPFVFNFTFPYAVETHAVSFNVYASDEDYNLTNSYELVNFTTTAQTGSLLFNVTAIRNSSNQTYGQVVFTPQLGSAGNYVVNITAVDYYGANYTLVKDFTINAKTSAPTINFVRPYANADSSINQTYVNASSYSQNQVSIDMTENTTVVFDINVTDDTTVAANINYTWFVDGTQVLKNKSYSRSFSFFSSGEHDIYVLVEDTSLENVTFAWNLTVSDVNRAPRLLNNLTNIPSINTTTIITDYLVFYSSQSKFLDPDDDLDSDNFLDSNETSTLTYSVTACTAAAITISSHDLRIEPSSVGSCTVTFTAQDSSGLTLESNTVTINITEVPEDETVTETPTSSSGGGGSSRSSPIPVPIVKQEVKPQPLQLIVPEIVTVYDNNTVIIPVTVKNTWNTSLKGIKLNATTESEIMQFKFSETEITELAVNQETNVTLEVSNYRLGEDYKIEIYGNVTSPKASDSAFVYLNSIEQSQSGKDVQTKVTFAQDLLNENPECLELNELLKEAKDNLENGGNPAEVGRIVDGVIEGCKYLVSVSKKSVQKPETILQKAIRKEYRPYLFAFLAVAGLSSLAVSGIRKRNEHLRVKALEEQKRKIKEEDEGFKPYWPGQ
jgi:hypothetical protein